MDIYIELKDEGANPQTEILTLHMSPTLFTLKELKFNDQCQDS